MKSSADFQTGSILLLTATLVCIGLAIAVIAPIIDSPLSGSTETRTSVLPAVQVKSYAQDPAFAEFYPTIERAKQELNRSQEMTGTIARQASHQPVNSHPIANSVNTARTEQWTTDSLQVVETIVDHNPKPAVPPANFPHHSVYAPITIHQPAVHQVPAGRQMADVAERIERLVTERERLAAAVELEKQKQFEIEYRTQQQQAAELQQRQIVRLEEELKRLNRSMGDLQSETSTHLSQLSKQNSQINVASQALDAYREALKMAKEKSARLAAAQKTQTAQANSKAIHRQPEPAAQQTNDDAGRVRISNWPPVPVPAAQPPQVAPIQLMEQAPQTASISQKRLHISSETPIQNVPKPEPVQQLLPLPEVIPMPIKPIKKSVPKAATTSNSAAHETNFIPLLDLSIPHREINQTDRFGSDSKATSDQNWPPKQTSVRHPSKTDVIPELNVAFEHTYQFDSTRIVQTAHETNTTEMFVPVVNFETAQQAVRQETSSFKQESSFQFKPIEFPDLSIMADGNEHGGNSFHDGTIYQTAQGIGWQKDRPSQLKSAQYQRQRTALTRPRSHVKPPAKPSAKPSWIQQVSGSLNPLGKPFASPSKKPTQSTRSTNQHGQKQGRHLHTKSTETKPLRLPLFSLKQRATKDNLPTSERPGVLKQISQSIQKLGKRPQ